ncbi:ent-kaurene synthase, putative [Medicago truncatula]|uniref:Ent-kaurene synthase, putative n=1 Tax=Medicago truncatula TaxID=3880 RepID=A0A072U8J1_MEDTR|nr:ent-kaurene synthase, putative [Medicago truncatula]
MKNEENVDEINENQRESQEYEQGKLNVLALHMIHGNGAVTYEDAIDKMKDVIEENRKELLRLVLQEKGSLVARKHTWSDMVGFCS